MDNCEAVIDNSGEEFRALLSYWMDKCKMLKMLVVSRNELASREVYGEHLQPQILPQLGSKQAVQFFIQMI